MSLAPSLQAELQATLHGELPITVPLGIRVRVAEPERIVLAAPLAINRNHAGTAFAGSLNAIATLAGWSWLWVFLREHRLTGRVVIQDSSIRYNRPVSGDFEASCLAPSPAAISRFVAALRRVGRARLGLEVTVSDQAGAAVAFTGRYVAEAIPPSPEP